MAAYTHCQEHALELVAKNEECPSNQEQLVPDEELGKKSPLSPSNINDKEKVSSLEKELKVCVCVYSQ